MKDPSKGKQRSYKKFPSERSGKTYCPWRCYGKTMKEETSFQDGGKGTWGGRERGWVLFRYSGGAQEWLGKRDDFGRERELGVLCGFENALKDLDNLLGSQRSDKNKEGLGYNAVLPLLHKSIHLLRKIYLGQGNPQNKIDDKGYWDNGCSQHMTGNISYLSEYEPYDGGYVSFGHGGRKIIGKGIIKTSKLEFENVYFVKKLKYNLFSVSQICDNKNSVLFTNSECLMLGKDFKLKDDSNVLLRTPRQHNMYSIDLNNIFPHKNLTCLVAKASVDESILWHRRLGHLNFKTMNKLVRNNLVKGLSSKCFENDHTCVAYLKEKQHKASCKT
nr:ribonuclease H-like domain-containing protein [Tanacetum cinerariifolium]